ncbi:MAG TPA: LysM peptidoglycan-binding domain-containing protein [Armatimonadota bacterium]|jgi:proteasome lid subunit RPN8/RPN11
MTTPEPSHRDEEDVDLDITLAPVEPSGDRPEIWMDPAVAASIEQFAQTDTTRELGGVLLGELRTDGPRPLVRVTAAIEAKHTEAVSTSVKFTHATWDDIHRVKDEQYPGLKIVGWYHTHPGFGIFLSRWDLFIQHNFFNLPWQIAYVVDPIGKTRGFFRWEDGKVERADRPPAEPAPTRLAPIPPGQPIPAAYQMARAALVAGGVVVGVALGVAYMAFFRPPRERIVERVVVRTVTVPAAAPAPAAPPAGKREEPPPAAIAPAPAPKATSSWSRAYTVRPGDSLWQIASAQYGDGRAAEAIRVLNHIQDPNALTVGGRLLLPSEDLAKTLAAKP